MRVFRNVALAVAASMMLVHYASADMIVGGGYSADNTTVAAFSDISGFGGGGTPLGLGDDSSSEVVFGFTFEFFGTSYTSVFVGSNGLMTFGAGSGDFSNEDLSNGTDTADDLPVMAVFWDDLNPADASSDDVYFAVQGTPGSQTLVVQWNDVAHFTGGGAPAGETVSFQAVLEEGTNAFEYRYGDATFGGANAGNDGGGSATIAIHDGTAGGSFLQWNFNGDKPVSDGESIRFEVIPEPASAGLIGLAMIGGLLVRRRRK